jgi:hypothetical protein
MEAINKMSGGIKRSFDISLHVSNEWAKLANGESQTEEKMGFFSGERGAHFLD